MTCMFTHRAGWAGTRPAQLGSPPGGSPTSIWTASILAGVAMLGSLLFSHPAAAQGPQPVFASGDAVVTGFSGIKPPEGAPSEGANPLDGFFIDTAGASMKIFKLGEPGEPNAQVLNVPADFKVPASEIGQVFSVTLDDGNGSGAAGPAEEGGSPTPLTPPNIYLGATSVYGLNIVVPGPDGQPKRSQQGAPGAMWMDGQFALAKNGGPGSIWRVDGTTGEVTLFANVPTNSGPSIGDIVFDRGSRQFFASDLDSGLIHRIGADGNVIDSFDHGTMARPLAGQPPLPDDGSVADIINPAFDSEKPETWGFTQRERMVWGLAIQGGRLYYAVQSGPEIWSVGIEADGSFGKDARLEIKVDGLAGDTYISDMLFDAKGRLYLAQRGEFRGSYDYSVLAEPKKSDVLRYGWDAQTGLWHKIPDTYAIGFPEAYKNASGGIAIGQCSTRLWTTGDNLRNNPAHIEQLTAGGPLDVHGLQGNDIELVRPQNEPPFKTWFVDYDGQFGDAEKAGHVGDVEIWQSCQGGGGQSMGYGEYLPPYGELPPGWVPPSRDRFNLRLTKHARPRECHRHGAFWVCRFVIRVRNTGPAPYFGPVLVHDTLPGLPGGSAVSFAFQPPWNCAMLGANDFRCNYPPVFLAPGSGVDLFVTVRVPLRTRECRVHNRAELNWPAGGGDANPGDDADSATAHIPSEHCDDNNERTNLRIEKRPHRCARFGHGFRCSYSIVVTNTGPGQYNGQIRVEDTVPAGTTASFPGLGWACAGGPPTYTCTHGWVSLGVAETRSLHVVVNVPVELARRMECQVRNVARITFAPGGSPRNTNPGDDQDGAVANIPGDLCDQTPVPIIKTPACPPGYIWNGQLCYRPERPECPPGTHGRYPRCVPDEGPRCPPGTHGKYPDCTPTHCPRYMHMSHGHCCPRGKEWNGQTCETPGTRDCPPGTHGKYPRCIADETPRCPGRLHMSHGHCCPPGKEWNGQMCTRGGGTTECPQGTVGKYPRCKPIGKCPEGSIGKYPHCRQIRHCPEGMTGKYPNCRKIIRHCPDGMIRKGGTCTPKRVIKRHDINKMMQMERQRARQFRPMRPMRGGGFQRPLGGNGIQRLR